ncbi:MAG: hypothetical protein V1664_00915 [Candidatus Uhrbacteria bacterium]
MNNQLNKTFKKIKKLHLSEILLILMYIVFTVACLLFKEFQSFLTLIICISLALAVIFSFWSLVHKKAVSPLIWPMHIFFGYLVGFCFFAPSGLSGGPAALWLAVCFIVVVTTFIQIIFCLIFARKDFLKMLLIMVGGFLTAYLIDQAFISPQEYGEHSRSYLLKEYSAWQILDDSSFFRF